MRDYRGAEPMTEPNSRYKTRKGISIFAGIGQAAMNIRSDQRGLTLLEMIAALAILAFGIIAVLHSFSSSMTTSKVAEVYSVAAGLAQQVAFDLERRQSLETGHESGTFAGEDSSYAWEADIRPTATSSLFRASIVVSWRSGAHSRHLRMLTCLRSAPASQTKLPSVANSPATEAAR